VLDQYSAALARNNAAVNQARKQLSQYSEQLLALEPSSHPTDVWGFLSLAADEFASTDSNQRVVLIVARDEEIQSTYCDGCHHLRGAAVHFLALDQPTPADQLRRRSDWVMWLARVGARTTTFTRSNEPIPPLFPELANRGR
jgi:hypothetical protein